MAKNILKTRLREVTDVLGALLWRSFGLFLFILGGAAGTGAIVAGSWLDGIVISFGTLLLAVIASLGYAIAVTGKATKEDVAKAAQDAVQKAQDATKK